MKYIPKLRGYYLDLISVSDGMDYGIVVKEYPYSNKNEIENTGRKSRNISLSCVFGDNPAITPGWSESDGIFPTYEAHFNFISTIDSTMDSHVFTHPEYGEITGYVKNVSTVYDDTINNVTVSFEFVEYVKEENIVFVNLASPAQAKGFRDVNASVKAAISEAYAVTKNPTQWLAEAETRINKLETLFTAATSPATSIVNTINYGEDISSRLMQSINNAVDRVVQSYVEVRNSPASFINNVIVAMRDLVSSFYGLDAQRVHIMAATRLGYECSIEFEIDDQNRDIAVKGESTQYFDVLGNFKGSSDIPETLTITELDMLIYTVREFMDEAVQFDRSNRGLIQQAKDLQLYVNKIKVDREKIITKQYSMQPLHSIISSEGLNHLSAERILKLNPQIVNPNFAYGDIKILV
jgi:prophage DNA circulation protein